METKFQTYNELKIIRQASIQWSQFAKVKKGNFRRQYLIMSHIGEGAFGVVKKIKQIQTGQLRSVKIIQKRNMKLEDQKSIKLEVQIMKKIDHPNVVKLFQVYESPSELVLIIQYCQGGDLFQSMRKKKLSESKTRKILKQLLKALLYLHSRGIIYRDIKPENILYEEQSNKKNIKLIDFGISTYLTESELLQDRFGTPFYLSPQMVKEGYYDSKCDIWAVGVTMYYLMSGNFSYMGRNQDEVYENILKKDPTFYGQGWLKVSNNCKDVIKLMLQKDPIKRPSAKQLLEDQYFKEEEVQECKTSHKKQVKKEHITTGLRTFRFRNKLQAIMQTFIAAQILTTQEKKILRQLFQQFDSNKDGVISSVQLRQGLQKKKKISAERIDTLLFAIDTNGNGEIDYTQFLAAGFNDQVKNKKERLKKVFKHFDSNQNGQISYEQVIQFLSNYEESEEQIKNAFKQFDTNGDGLISEDEFIDLLLKETSKIDTQKIKQKSMIASLQKKKWKRSNKKITKN